MNEVTRYVSILEHIPDSIYTTRPAQDKFRFVVHLQWKLHVDEGEILSPFQTC